jgi:LCP family protein required for cell wall assembly
MNMSDTSAHTFYAQQAGEAGEPEGPAPRQKPHRGLKRLALASAATIVALVATVAGGGYLWLNHKVGSVQRIQVAALDAKDQAAFAGGRPGSLNILLTASGLFPGRDVPTGLIELLHLNGDQQGGAVISFPANLLVRVPGHGKQRLGETQALGGPSLMIETVERLTGVRIEHYSRITISGLAQIVGSMGCVNVSVPYATTSFGIHFQAGVNCITSVSALPYVRQVAVSQVTRTELQENLFRAVLHKIANRRYFVATDWRVLDAVVRAVSVDSDLSNSRLERLALSLGHLSSRGGVSIDVPTSGAPGAGITTPVFLQTRLADKLWRAIRTDSVAQLAQRYPSLVTPIAPG